jgi:hypothetical protein
MNAAPEPDPDSDLRWILALYGATMMAVQGLEHAVSWLYLLDTARRGRTRRDGQGAKRQWMELFAISWKAFQQGTSRMKLNDAQRGIRHLLEPELYDELDRFFAGPRAQLAHRFLVERIEVTDGTPRFRSGAALSLLEATMQANALTAKLSSRADDIRLSWPVGGTDIPDDVREFAEMVARMTMFKEFPSDMPLDTATDELP